MDFGFSPDVEDFNLRFQRCRVLQSEVALHRLRRSLN